MCSRRKICGLVAFGSPVVPFALVLGSSPKEGAVIVMSLNPKQ